MHYAEVAEMGTGAFRAFCQHGQRQDVPQTAQAVRWRRPEAKRSGLKGGGTSQRRASSMQVTGINQLPGVWV